MRRKIALFTFMLLVAAAVGASAASPGATLPPGAMDPGTYEWNGTGWVEAQYAKSWNSVPVSSGGMSNKEVHSFTIINHISVAQWVEYTISGTRKDWRVLRPGIYASNSVTAVIRSNNDVIIEFYATDPEYEDPEAGVTRTIPKWFSYSTSNTLTEVEENGWVRGSDYSAESPLVITLKDSAGLHAGLTFKLWEKIEVVPSNTSSDYEGYGVVTIKLTNMKHWVDPELGDFYPGGRSSLDPEE